MSGDLPGTRIEEAARRSGRRELAYAVLIGIAGIVEVTVAFVVLASRLPPVVPDHFDLSGNVDGSLPAWEFLAVSVGTIAALTALFAVMTALTVRSPPLQRNPGPATVPRILVIEAVTLALAVPGSTVFVLVRASGSWSPGPAFTIVILFGFPLLAVLLVIAAVGRWRSTGTPASQEPAPPGAPTAKAFVGVGGPIELQCSSCGRTFVLSGVPLLAPHMGFAGRGSLYVRCPACGERGWDAVLRHLG